MTYVNDPIGDFLTRMRNAPHANKASCLVPWSRIKEQLAELMKKEEWIAESKVLGEGTAREIEITFVSDKPSLTLKRISKPGRRVYAGLDEIKPVLHGFGIAVITTSHGLMTDVQARKEKVGGEILCTIS